MIGFGEGNLLNWFGKEGSVSFPIKNNATLKTLGPPGSRSVLSDADLCSALSGLNNIDSGRKIDRGLGIGHGLCDALAID